MPCLGEDSCLPLAHFWSLLEILDAPWRGSSLPVSASAVAQCSVCVPSYVDLSYIESRVHSNSELPHLNLLISTNNLFPNMVTFLGSQWTWILMKNYSTQHKILSFTFFSKHLPFHIPYCPILHRFWSQMPTRKQTHDKNEWCASVIGTTKNHLHCE